MARKMITTKVPTEDLVYTNCAVVNDQDFDASRVKHVEIQTGPARRFVLSIKNHPSVPAGKIAFGVPQRKWAELGLDMDINVSPMQLSSQHYIGAITLTADFHTKKGIQSAPLDSDHMAREFGMSFGGQAFSVGMMLIFRFEDKATEEGKPGKTQILALRVKTIESVDITGAAGEGEGAKPSPIQLGQLLPNSIVTFDKEPSSQLNLIGKSKGKQAFRTIFSPDWDFAKMGIGGLDTEFSAIFRRAFASRMFPADFIEQLGMKHVRGILLYGPPGTGKTLMARQIGKMLNAREPKIVNGPQILDKYVGESEANIRKLFADAEAEWARCGANSGLHIIIFDEIDAICKARGSTGSSSAVHDTVVNQLLSKIDGVDQLNNILVIGMTNRRDMIDEALLRPGRLEVQMMISLADEFGRSQILKIHTARMKEYEKLGADVDIAELARITKNFSGAELEGLVRAAQSSAMNRLVKTGGSKGVDIDPEAIEKLCVQREDFMYAMANDVKPAFGHADDILDRYLGGGILEYNSSMSEILADGMLHIEMAKSPDTRGLVSVLLQGAPNTGKTALAANIAKHSDFPFIKVISPEDMIGFTETAKCTAIRKVFDDAYKSPFSVVLVDNIERLLDYAPIGPRYSNLVLQALLVLLKMKPVNKKCRMLILCTSSNPQLIADLQLSPIFTTVIHVSPLMTGVDVMNVLKLDDVFNASQLGMVNSKLAGKRVMIGIKKLLDMIDLVKQTDVESRIPKFLCKMEEEGGLEMT